MIAIVIRQRIFIYKLEYNENVPPRKSEHYFAHFPIQKPMLNNLLKAQQIVWYHLLWDSLYGGYFDAAMKP